MVLGSVYISVLLTNWGAPVINSKKWDAYLPSDTSMWVKLICSYVSTGLYIWSLVASRIFPDRF